MLLYAENNKPKQWNHFNGLKVHNSLKENNVLLTEAREVIIQIMCRTVSGTLNKNKHLSFFLNTFFIIS